MRRIIKGKSYDTDTAKLIAVDRYEIEDNPYSGSDPGRYEEWLYRTKGGAFFRVDYRYRLGSDDGEDVSPDIAFVPASQEDAEIWWRSTENAELFDEDVFVAPDEATAEDEVEKTVALTLRVPASLRDRLAKASTKESLSMNAYLLRCAHRCLREAA